MRRSAFSKVAETKVIIADIDQAVAALEGRAGTHILADADGTDSIASHHPADGTGS